MTGQADPRQLAEGEQTAARFVLAPTTAQARVGARDRGRSRSPNKPSGRSSSSSTPVEKGLWGSVIHGSPVAARLDRRSAEHGHGRPRRRTAKGGGRAICSSSVKRLSTGRRSWRRSARQPTPRSVRLRYANGHPQQYYCRSDHGMRYGIQLRSSRRAAIATIAGDGRAAVHRLRPARARPLRTWCTMATRGELDHRIVVDSRNRIPRAVPAVRQRKARRHAPHLRSYRVSFTRCAFLSRSHSPSRPHRSGVSLRSPISAPAAPNGPRQRCLTTDARRASSKCATA